MKLSELVATVTELKNTLASFIGDKTKATSEALTAFSGKLTALETSAAAELNQKTADLTTAQASITSITSERDNAQNALTAIGTQLKTACTALSLEVKEGATSTDMVSSLQTAVTATLAKLQVDPSKVPAAVPNKNGESPKSSAKKTLDEQVAEAKNKTVATK